LSDFIAAIEDERRNAHQGIDPCHLVGVGENGDCVAHKWYPIQMERDADAPHEGGIILTDEDHRILPLWIALFHQARGASLKLLNVMERKGVEALA